MLNDDGKALQGYREADMVMDTLKGGDKALKGGVGELNDIRKH